MSNKETIQYLRKGTEVYGLDSQYNVQKGTVQGMSILEEEKGIKIVYEVKYSLLTSKRISGDFLFESLEELKAFIMDRLEKGKELEE